MTLGRKLAGYRKLTGLTQQQLGEKLNLSAQAISKWEKDLSEPDLATLRALAELYKVTVDELLDLNSGFTDPTVLELELEQEEKNNLIPIGFCKECGVTITEANVGKTEPVVLCKKCVTELDARAKRAAAEEKRINEAIEAEKEKELNARRSKQKHHRTLAAVIGGIVSALFLLIAVIGLISDFSTGMLFFTLIGTYVVFAFVFCLFYDCIVQDVVLDWFDKSIHWPGLIFTFDLDGILWLIGMRILFFVLGVIFGIITGAIGITLGLLFAPFAFPFVIKKVNHCVRNGIEYEEEL